MHFHLREEKKVENEGSSAQEQHFQKQKNVLTAYPALSKGILRPPKMCSMGNGNQPNPSFTEPLPVASAEAPFPEAAGESACKCRPVLPLLGYCHSA